MLMADENEVHLADVITALGRRRKIIFTSAGAFVLVGLLYAVFETPLYTATATVIPADEQDTGALSSLAASLGPAAAFAGINLGGGTSGREAYLAILRSRELAEQFISQNQLLPYLFPSRWNFESQSWKETAPGLLSGIKRAISRGVAALSGDQGWREPASKPTVWEAVREFNRIRTISEDSLTGIVTVSLEFRDPNLAAQWANGYVALANQEIRERTVAESSRALAYLDERAEETSIVGLRETIYRLVETQLEKIMLANVREEFAFRVIDSAAVPEQRSHPSRVLVVMLSLALGLVLGCFAVLGWESYKGGLARDQF